MKKIQALLVVITLLSLGSCAKGDDDNNPYQGQTAKQLYANSNTSLRKEQYATAAKQLEALETMYPFSDFAEQAQMKLIFAYYRQEDYALCAATADRFIHLYPRATHVDYAYYMKALANFQQPRGTFSYILPIDESLRDPGTQAQSYADFSVLVQRFPESPYKANALQRMIYLRNLFAQRELNTAKFYFERKMYVAAAGRADYLIKTYQQAPSVREALVILYQSNKALGLYNAANETLTIYEATYHSKLS
jgi:outer membrane protein assembly factor BamD